LKTQKLISDIATYFKDPHGAIKSVQELAVHLCPGHPEMALVEFLHGAQGRPVPLRILLSKIAGPFLELPIRFPHISLSSQILT
jgi:hypothetical protein